MRKLAVALTVAAALVVTAIVQGQSKTDPALNKVSADFAAAYNAKDAAKAASFYAEDAVVMPPNGPMVKGRTAIQERMKQDMQKNPVTLKLTPIESAISGDQAYEAGTSIITMSDGRRQNEKYLVVYKRVAGEWKVAFDIWNGDTPPAPQK